MSDENGEKKVTHKIEISRSEEIDSLQKEKFELEQKLKEKEALLEQSALSEFERQKTELKERFPQGRSLIDSCTDGNMLQDLASNLKDSYGSGKRAPSGKAPLTRQPNGEEFEDSRAMVDELYSVAYDRTKDVTEAQRKETVKKIDSLVESMFSGRSWKQLQDKKIIPELMNFRSCPKCGKTIDLTKDFNASGEPACRYCNYVVKRSDR